MVHSSWVTDSIASGTVLNEEKYEVGAGALVSSHSRVTPQSAPAKMHRSTADTKQSSEVGQATNAEDEGTSCGALESSKHEREIEGGCCDHPRDGLSSIT